MIIANESDALSSLVIVGSNGYLNANEKWIVPLPHQWDAQELCRLVIQYCNEYDRNYIDEENVKHVVRDAIRIYFEGKSDAARAKHNETRKDEETYELSKLTDIDDPQYAEKKVKVKAVVASNTTSYNVPRSLNVTCSLPGEHKCPKSKEVDLLPSQIARYPDSRNREQLNREFAKQHFTFKCNLTWSEKSDTLYRVRVRPYVSSLIFNDDKTLDETGIEYKHYDILMMGQHDALEPGSIYEITGFVIPDPRSQKVTLFATNLVRDSSSEYDARNVEKLRVHLSSMSLKERIDWYLSNFQKYSRVRKREDVALASLLSFFSPLWIQFEGKIERGWLLVLVLGDSTTGKSETVKRTIKLLGGGQYVVAETASVVGLSATATQTANGWFVEWGPLVLGDRKLLAIDGAQKLSRQEWSTLAEAIRLGTVKITKAARGEAHARTRQILIANPVDYERRGTKEMDGFLYPYLALPSILDAVNIARLDLAIFVNTGDVKIEDINTPIDDNYDEMLHALKDLRAFVWEGKYEAQHDEDFLNTIHGRAIELHNKYFVNNVPLASKDIHFKLVRLSTALALATCSFDETLKKLVITKDHVDFVADYMDEIYHRAGLDADAKKERENSINLDQVQLLIASIAERLGLGSDNTAKAKEILLWVGKQSSFTKDQLKSRFDLADKEELRPLVGILQAEGLISRGSGFYPTSRGIQVAKLILKDSQSD